MGFYQRQTDVHMDGNLYARNEDGKPSLHYQNWCITLGSSIWLMVRVLAGFRETSRGPFLGLSPSPPPPLIKGVRLVKRGTVFTDGWRSSSLEIERMAIVWVLSRWSGKWSGERLCGGVFFLFYFIFEVHPLATFSSFPFWRFAFKSGRLMVWGFEPCVMIVV